MEDDKRKRRKPDQKDTLGEFKSEFDFKFDMPEMNLSILETGGDLVLVPQFTLYADCRKGRRPGFSDALEPGLAALLFARFAEDCSRLVPGLILGKFGTHMDVHLVNEGPVTILLDSADMNLRS